MSDNALSRRQKTYLAALVQAPSVTVASQDTGVPRDTVYRWLREDAFRAALDAQLDAALTAATQDLAARCALALDTLAEIAQDRGAPPAARVAAAAKIIEGALRFYEVRALAQRLAELERMVSDGDPGTN